MRRAEYGLAVALSICLVLTLMPGTALAQPTVHVYNIMDEYQSSHNTISDGIAAASDWWTIKVEEGEYVENALINREGLTLESTEGPDDTNLVGYFQVGAKDLTIDGFSIDATGAFYAIFNPVPEDGLKLINNQMTGSSRGIRVEADMEATGNEFLDMDEGVRIEAAANPDGITITGNSFSGNQWHVLSYLDDEQFMQDIMDANDFAVPVELVEGVGEPWEWAIMDIPVYAVTFSEANGLEGVDILVDGETVTTDANGDATIELPDGEYEFTASKTAYLDYQGEFTVAGGPETIAFTMEDTDYFDVEITDFPGELAAGEDAVIEYSVENIGGIAGTQSIVLEVNGVIVDQENQALSAGAINLSTLTAPASAFVAGENQVAIASVNDRSEVTIDSKNGLPVDRGAQEVRMTIGSTTILVDGVPQSIDVAPFIEESRTFVPVRFLAEAFAATADWGPKDAQTEWVTLTRSDIHIYIEIGNEEIMVTREGQQETVIADAPARITRGRTMLPFRAIAEAFGADVGYATDPVTGLVTEVWFTQQP